MAAVTTVGRVMSLSPYVGLLYNLFSQNRLWMCIQCFAALLLIFYCFGFENFIAFNQSINQSIDRDWCSYTVWQRLL